VRDSGELALQKHPQKNPQSFRKKVAAKLRIVKKKQDFLRNAEQLFLLPVESPGHRNASSP